MRALPPMATAVAVALLTLSCLTACGGSDDDPAAGDSQAVVQDDPAQDEPASSDDTEDQGGGGTVSFTDCSAITAEEMAAVPGMSPGTSEVSPGGGQCEYEPTDPVQPTVYLEQFATDDFADGFTGAADNITGTGAGPIGDPVTSSLQGVGDGAAIVVGTSPLGGESLQSIGLVLIGDTIVRATILQAADLDEPALTELTTGVLTLIASKG
jgi:hypothetical protein